MKATLVVNVADFLHNGVFSDAPIKGVKNYGYMFAELRRQLAVYGVDLSTQDINPPENSSLVIGLDYADFFQTYDKQPSQLLYLMLYEPDTYFPEVWKKENHQVFDKVFTYDYKLSDEKKYIHHYFAIDLDEYPPFRDVTEAEFNKRKLLVLMSAMFQLTPPKAGSKSLLYARYRTLRWFGKHLPQNFDFYSRGVETNPYRSFRGLGIIRKVLPSVVANRVVEVVAGRRQRAVDALNRGPVPPLEKLSVIRSYRFVVCYENTSTPGYISEKIFDCLFAGCVPVYLGEPEVSRFIPEDCFIDRRLFKSDAALSRFLTQMTYPQYAGYIRSIREFLSGIDRQKFSSEANAKRVADVLVSDMRMNGAQV